MQNDPIQKLIAFHADNKRMPSYSEMAELFGFKSKNAVYRLVQKLLDAGTVAKDSMGRLIPTNMFSEIPMLGSVKAGLPSATDEALIDDTVNLNDLLIQKRGETYLMTVDGDSMIDAHIADGDLVIAERTNTARDGQIVIANVDGEFTMKYLRRDAKNPNKIWLEPANKKFKNIYPENNLDIVAVVKGVVRKYK
ncbi:MAG: lexA [Patescibacteria group bacterium]|nr:lexA [Patescibacteria group bacterium]